MPSRHCNGYGNGEHPCYGSTQIASPSAAPPGMSPFVKFSRMLIVDAYSGGNLAAVLAHKAAQLFPPIPLIFQLLIVPVTDNTASASGVPHASWRENEHTPWLTPKRMLWLRRQYLPHEPTWARWDASPLLAQNEMFRKVPKAWIAVAELDIVRDEGIAYGKKLQKAGIPTEIKTYKGAPHPIMAMDGTYRLCQW